MLLDTADQNCTLYSADVMLGDLCDDFNSSLS